MNPSLESADSEPYIYVQQAAQLNALVARLAKVERVALDTEADSLHNYYEKVCLIQLSLNGDHYLVDPLCGLDLTEFAEALADKPLVLHGADYDLRMLRINFNFRPRAEVFDTMIAAQLLGFEQIGLAALIEKYFQVIIGKEGQKSDWSQRPLSEKQLRYAVNDTRYLIQLAEILTTELNERGRLAWHKESCAAMVETSGRDRVRDPDDVWRLKGSGKFTHRQLAYLREIWQWREGRAQRANRPPFKIFGNEQIFQLVQWADANPGAPLDQGPKLPRNIRDHLLRTLDEAVARVAALAPEQWPERKKFERPEPPSAEVTKRIELLRTTCGEIAKELGIAAATLAPRAALEAIARKPSRSIEETMATGNLLRWQAELIQGAVGKCIAKV
ncbi:MAG: hypothetical protein FJ145_06985 [Deltaproteobacteria bacterium]|nr:hypothetical protein [Deltaproteobacteria bacterium]